jgi:DNA-binding CsgD family transcriptional regulator/5-methylcytosine-specific restriction endonuclease McrA
MQRDEQIRHLLLRGMPKARIARRLGIDRSTVSRVAARVGFPSSARAADGRDWAAIRKFYEQGHSAAECMRRFGFTESTWDAAISRGEVVPRPRNAQRPPGERRRQVERLLNEGIGIAEIAERLGVAKPTVCYHARRLGVPAQERFRRRFDWEEIQRAYSEGLSMRECMLRFGFSRQAWSDAVKRGDVVPRDRRIPLELLLVQGRPTSRGHLKNRLVAAGLKEDRCEECGLSEWRGRRLGMQLHHKNGDGLDNRLENLVFLCPNCHSQTDTYGGRNGHQRPGPHLELVEAPDAVGEAERRSSRG